MQATNNKKQRKTIAKSLFLVTQLGLCMVAALAVGGVIGYLADRLLGTKPIFTILFLVLGMVAGYRSGWSMVSEYTKEPKEETAPARDPKLEEAEQEFRRWKEQQSRS